MTDQISEALTNEHPALVLGDFRLFAVIRGEPAAENHGWGPRDADGRLVGVYRADPGPCKTVMTSNWKGYQEVWKLRAPGELVLVRFAYDDGRPTRLVNERITGDFYMVFKSTFDGPRQYVRFVDGSLSLDRATWKHEIQDGAAMEIVGGVLPSFPRGPER